MANTYHQIYLQTIFPVKYRRATIRKPWSKQLHAVIGNLINEAGGNTIIINDVNEIAVGRGTFPEILKAYTPTIQVGGLISGLDENKEAEITRLAHYAATPKIQLVGDARGTRVGNSRRQCQAAKMASK